MANNDVTDYQDIIFEAQAIVAEVVDEVMEELTMPIMMQALKLQWTTMPDEIKEQLRKVRPDMYDMITRMMVP